MKDTSFSIKIADLLSNPGTKDRVSFIDKFSTSLPQLVDRWITVTIDLLWLSNEEVNLVFTKLLATFQTECDICWQQCRHTVKIDSMEAKGAFTEDLQKEDIIIIQQRTWMMDLENFFIQTLSVSKPVVISCKTCWKKQEDIPDDMQEYTKVIWK